MRAFVLSLCCLALGAVEMKTVRAATPQAALARLLLKMHDDGVLPAVDKNKDALLSQGELCAIGASRRTVDRLMAEADGDKDGLLALTELQGAIGKAMAVQVIGAPGSRRNRVDAQVIFTRDTAYISDYDIAVDGNDRGTPDPVITVIRTGTTLGVSGLRLTSH